MSQELTVERIAQKRAEANKNRIWLEFSGLSRRGLVLFAPNFCPPISNKWIAFLHTSCVQLSFITGYMRCDLGLTLITTKKLKDTNDGKLKVMHKEMVCEMLFSYAENILCTTTQLSTHAHAC